MPCYHPLKAYRSASGRAENGKWPIVFSPAQGYIDMPIEVPCGQCIGCRLERSRQWAVRCVHEASLYEKNCFVTLTYDNQHLDPKLSLNKDDFVKFMKRLRFRFEDERIRFFHCGEYGSLFQRPHHHTLLFNFDFADKQLWSVRRGVRLYRSAELEKLWPFGFCSIGDVTFESAAYVARYILKKVTGDIADAHYKGRLPEYITMSRRPGIARDWFDKYQKDVYPRDEIIIRDDLKCKPPRYYDSIYDLQNPSGYVTIKLRRKAKATNNSNNTPDRLKVRETIQKLRAAKLLRNLE